MSIAVALSSFAPSIGGETSIAGSNSGLSSLSGGGSGNTPFADLLNDAVGAVSSLQDQAHATVSGLLTGSGVDVHTAMIATEKADMAFEMALAVRNKAVQAYQQVVGMQF